MGRIISRMLLVLFLLLATLPPAVMAATAAEAETAVELKATAGLDGQVRIGGWAPVRVTAENQGRRLTGLLQVASWGLLGSGRPEYAVPVVLETGVRSQWTLLAPAESPGSGFQVSLTVEGREVASIPVRTSAVNGDDVLAAVVSDDPAALQSLGQARLWGRRVQLARLDAADLPEHPRLWDPIQILAISRARTARLTGPQVRAVQDWVQEGGVLVLGGGPEWSETVAGLPAELLPVQVTGVRRGVSLKELATVSSEPLAQPETTVATGNPQRGATLVWEGPDPLISVTEVGLGRVIWLAADPTLEPLASWKGMSSFWERLFVYLGNSPYPRSGTWTTGMAQAMERMRPAPLPNQQRLGELLALYAMLIGPGSWLILRLLGRREILVWVTVPAVSLAGLGLVYWQYGRQRDALAQSVTVYHFVPGASAASVSTYTGVFIPSGGERRIDLRTAGLVSAPPATSSTAGVAQGTQITRDGGVKVNLKGLNLWDVRTFAVEESAPAPTVDLDLRLEDDRVVGSVTNRTGVAMRDVLLLNWENFLRISRIEPGDRVAVDLAMQPNTRLPAGPYRRAVGFRMPADAEGIRERLIQDAALGVERDWPTAPVRFLAWLDRPLPGVRATGNLGYQVQSSALLVARFAPSFDPRLPYVPAGILRPLIVSSGGQAVFRGPYPVVQMGKGQATLRFYLPPVDLAQVAQGELVWGLTGPGGNNVKVRAWEWQKREWQELKSRMLDELPRYVSSNGLLEIQLDTDGPLQIFNPSLALKGR